MPEHIDPARQRAARRNDFMEELIESGKRFPVLNDGFIQVVDYMGTDAAVVNAARLTAGTLTPGQTDRGLLRYLLRNRHTTPFEFCELVIHVRIPMDAWRQYIRHRTASVNEYSTRYSPAIDSRQLTGTDEWRTQSQGNRQGSSGFLTDWSECGAPREGYETPGDYLTAREAEFHAAADALYQERLALGVAREQARKDLPLSTYTEAYWKIDLHNLLHFLGLRMDHHAQKEIRDYANVVGNEIVANWCPTIWEAFNDFRLGASYLTRLEAIALTSASMEDVQQALDTMTKRERQEVFAKSSMFAGVAPERVSHIHSRIDEKGALLPA